MGWIDRLYEKTKDVRMWMRLWLFSLVMNFDGGGGVGDEFFVCFDCEISDVFTGGRFPCVVSFEGSFEMCFNF